MAHRSQVDDLEQASQLSMQLSLHDLFEGSRVYPSKQSRQTPESQTLQLAILQMQLPLKRVCHSSQAPQAEAEAQVSQKATLQAVFRQAWLFLVSAKPLLQARH
jgi:hypothetical protein